MTDAWRSPRWIVATVVVALEGTAVCWTMALGD